MPLQGGNDDAGHNNAGYSRFTPRIGKPDLSIVPRNRKVTTTWLVVTDTREDSEGDIYPSCNRYQETLRGFTIVPPARDYPGNTRFLGLPSQGAVQ